MATTHLCEMTSLGGNVSTLTMNLTNTTSFANDVIPLPLSTYVFQIIFISIIALVGIPGNVLVIYVQYKNRNKSTTDYIVFTMASVDLICSGLSGALYIVREVASIFQGILSSPICYMHYYVTFFISTASTLLLTSIAADRYIHTCRPFNSFYSTRRAKQLCFITIGVSLGSSLPAFSIFKSDSTKRSCIIDSDSVLTNDILSGILMLAFVAMFITVIICYTRVVLMLKRRGKQKLMQIKSQQSQRSIIETGPATPGNEGLGKFTSIKLFSSTNNRVVPLLVEPQQNEVVDSNSKRTIELNTIVEISCADFRNVSNKKIDLETSSFVLGDKGAERSMGSKHSLRDREKPSTSNLQKNVSISTNNVKNAIISSVDVNDENSHIERQIVDFGKIRLTEEMRKVNRTTLIMFCVTVIYICTWVVHWLVFGFTSQDSYNGRMAQQLIKTSFMINCMTNPICYFSLSSKFRKIAKLLFCKTTNN